MQTGSRERRLLIITVLLAIAAILQMGVIRPTLQRVRRMKTRTALTVQDLQRMRMIADSAGEIESSYEEIRSRITSSKTPEREVIEILLSIEEAAKESGVKIVENAYQGHKEFEHFDRHTVVFRGSGELEGLTRMLFQLQDPDLLLKVPRASFSMRNHVLEMELEITRIIYTPEGETDA